MEKVLEFPLFLTHQHVPKGDNLYSQRGCKPAGIGINCYCLNPLVYKRWCIFSTVHASSPLLVLLNNF